jgi:hypothetical protein
VRKKPKPIYLAVTFIVSGALGAAAVTPLAKAMKQDETGLVSWVRSLPGLLEAAVVAPLIVGLLIGSFIAAVAAHEFGHVLAGWLARFRFAFMMFWPVQIRRRGDKGISVSTMFRSGLGLGGIAGMIPERGVDLRRGYLTLLIGGPAASLICGLAAIGGFLALRSLIPLPASLLWTFGLFSCGLFVVAMIPSDVGGFLSDGAAIRLLRKGTPEKVEPYVAMMELTTDWAQGVRPALWSAEALRKIDAVAWDDPLSARVPYMLFLNVADQGDLTEARIQMNRLLENIDDIPRLLQPQYRLMNAWLAAREGRREEARASLAMATGGLMEKSDLAMVEAVILFEEDMLDEAKTKAREALALIDSAMMPDSQAFARSQCEAILA